MGLGNGSVSAEFQFSKITCITYGCTKTHARARTRHIHSHNRTHTYAHAPRHTQTHTEPQIAHLHRYLHVRADLHSVCVRHHDAHHARDGTRSGVVVGEYMDEDYMHVRVHLFAFAFVVVDMLVLRFRYIGDGGRACNDQNLVHL